MSLPSKPSPKKQDLTPSRGRPSSRISTSSVDKSGITTRTGNKVTPESLNKSLEQALTDSAKKKKEENNYHNTEDRSPRSPRSLSHRRKPAFIRKHNDNLDEESKTFNDDSSASIYKSESEEDEDDEGEMDSKPSPKKKRKLIEQKNYIGNSSLTKAEKNILKSYFRKDFFKRLKFVNDGITAFNSEQMIECFNKLRVTNNDEKSEKHSSIVRLMNSCVMSKRNYVIDRIKKQMKGKIQFLSHLFL